MPHLLSAIRCQGRGGTLPHSSDSRSQ